MRRRDVDRSVRQMLRRIVDQFDPEQVILFGSRARGDARRDSDVARLIVMPVEGLRRAKAVEIGVALDDILVAKDIIVVSPESFERSRDIVGTIEWPASREGRLLHARKPPSSHPGCAGDRQRA